MSSDREEIRWKFQITIDTLNTNMDVIENERKIVNERYDDNQQSWKDVRNYFLGGIGFGVPFVISLIQGHFLQEYYVLYSIIALVIGLGIFIVINSRLYTDRQRNQSVNTKYVEILYRILRLKTMSINLAVIETISDTQMPIIMAFMGRYTDSCIYELECYLHKVIKTEMPEQTTYRKFYQQSKTLMIEFKAITQYNELISVVEKFIVDFETNENTSKSTK